MCNIKMSTCLGVKGNFLGNQLLQKILKQGEKSDIISHHHYRVDTKLGEGVFAIFLIPFACTAFAAQLDKYLLPTIAPSP